MVSPTMGQCEYKPGDNPTCTSIESLNRNTLEGQSATCRVALQAALLG